MKRIAALAAVALLVAAAVLYVQRLQQDRHYQALLTDGKAALDQGQTYMAIESFSGALALRPDSMVAFYRRGQAYAAQGQDEKAVRDFRQATRLSPTAAAPLVALGALSDRRGDPAHAAEWYGQAADRLKDADPSVLYSLALALYRSGSPAAARDPLRRALARNEASPEGFYLLGLVLRDAQSPDEAIAALQHAVRLSPGFVSAHEELAALYHERGRFADEDTELGLLGSLDPRIDRRVSIALAAADRSDFDRAIDTLDAAVAAAPNDSRVYLAIGRVLIMRAEIAPDPRVVQRAEAALEHALGGTARRSEGLALYGRALFLRRDIAESERILREAIATSPVDPEAFAFLADAAEAAGHLAAARDALLDVEVLEGDTASPSARAARARRIGTLSFAMSDAPTAVVYLAQALDSMPDDAQLLGMLARARWQTGDQAGARAALGRALALSGTDVTLKRLSKAIH